MARAEAELAGSYGDEPREVVAPGTGVRAEAGARRQILARLVFPLARLTRSANGSR